MREGEGEMVGLGVEGEVDVSVEVFSAGEVDDIGFVWEMSFIIY
jgi:hypothetical protein